jgi:hypothetical protein
MSKPKGAPAPKSNAPQPIPDALRAKLAAEVKRSGEEPTRKRIGLARDSWSRALGGLSVTRGTALVIAAALEKGGGQ